jgi:hypothetical protein
MAENNSKAVAAFSNVNLALGFHCADVVLLRSEPFVVARESSLPLQYNAVAVAGPTLDQAGVVSFDLFGKAPTGFCCP